MLIVEDQDFMRQMLREYLQSAYPDANGIDLTAQVKEMLPDTAVIIVSQHAGHAYVERARAAAIAIAAAYQFRHSETDLRKNAVAAVKLVIGTPWIPSSGNVLLAKQLGFSRDQGLDVTLQPHPSGQLAFADLLNGKSDLAIVGGTPLAFESLRGACFYVLATTQESDESTKMVGRRDRGIEKTQDLAGKKLGTVFATTSEFVQDSILVLNNVDPRTIVRVNLAPAKTVDALLAGEMIP